MSKDKPKKPEYRYFLEQEFRWNGRFWYMNYHGRFRRRTSRFVLDELLRTVPQDQRDRFWRLFRPSILELALHTDRAMQSPHGHFYRWWLDRLIDQCSVMIWNSIYERERALVGDKKAENLAYTGALAWENKFS